MKNVVIGTVAGAVVGTVAVPVLMTIDVINFVSRWWYTPIMGAIAGGFAGQATESW